LSDEGLDAVERNDEGLVVGVDGKVAEGSRRGSLDFDVGAREEVEDGFESIAVDAADIFLGNLGEGKGG
jgi:hypothetical protein